MNSSIMSAVKAALIDLSGTLHIENTVTPGALQALTKLKCAGVKTKFVTNTTKESKEKLKNRLNSLGFQMNDKDIFTSLTAARAYLLERKCRPFYIVDDEAMEDFQGISTDDPNTVVVGLAPQKFDYRTMNDAFQLLMSRPHCQLLAIHKARYYQKCDGLHIGPGAFVECLEFASGRRATVVGKPSADFFLAALADLRGEGELGARDVVMIGDDVRDDIAGAQSVGMRGLLVRTGKYRSGDEWSVALPPHRTCDNFADAVDYITSSLVGGS